MLIDLKSEDIRMLTRTVNSMDAPGIEASQGGAKRIKPVQRFIHRAQESFELAKRCRMSDIIIRIDRNRLSERPDCIVGTAGDDKRFGTGCLAVVAHFNRFSRDGLMGLFKNISCNCFGGGAIAGNHAHRRRIDA